MTDIQLTEIPAEPVEREKVSMRALKSPKRQPREEIKPEKVELSKNIQRFDNRPKVIMKDPYAHNTVSLRKMESTPSAEQMVTNALYNAVGKVLGIDTAKEWGQYYDKIYRITKWAASKTKSKSVYKITRFLSDSESRIPALGNRRIDDFNIFVGLQKR